jgi:hypothetical protein
LDFSRLRTEEIVAGVAGLALLVFMFFDWFEGVAGAFEGEAEGLSGWDALTDWDGFLVLLAGLSGVALAALAAAGQRLNLGGLPRGAGTAVLGTLTTLMILWRVLLQDTDAEFGAFLGLAAAIALTVGAVMALREDGFEPLLAVAGGRTRATAAAPTTTTTRTASASTRTRRASGATSGGSRSSGSRSTGSRSGGSRAKGSRSSGTRSSGTRSSSSRQSSKRSGSSSRGRSGGSK